MRTMLLGLALATGCTEVTNAPLELALSSDVDRATFENAADYWRRCGVAIEAAPQADITVSIEPLSGEGGGVQRGGVIKVDPSNAFDAFIFAHEIGHVIGLRHDDSGAPAVMAQTRYPLADPYESDLEQLSALR